MKEALNLIPGSDCTGCSACLNGCPAGCIEMVPDERGFRYPVVDRDGCIGCGRCEDTCPVLNIGRFREAKGSTFVGCRHQDDAVRRESSSGGVFYALAKAVLSEGGLVFGARFSEDFRRVVHAPAGTLEELEPLRVSKYVQSEVETAFPKVRNALLAGRTVLFTGTPCQVAGLKAYLDQPFERLYLAEVVCHGIPSQKAWETYLGELEELHGGKTVSVTFRDKTRSWRRSDFRVAFDNGTSFSQPNGENPYMRSFIRNLNLRPSCTRCAFKRFFSGADLTLGDFWGSTELGPEYSDDIGITILGIHTDRGRSLFERIRPELSGIRSVDEKTAYVFNESYARSAVMHRKADAFFDGLGSVPYPALVERLLEEDKTQEKTSRGFFHKIVSALKRRLIH